ncbi:hypothetical protein ASE04_18725 [Rhizobium sp. Root708]|uniref:DUF2934 domain-containing protein n=1 Tax=Rhizobium sp. Root708 TaxID=1736592 RepID=UPI000700CCDE|nr:DUF2934 domain-containing protein [Rhizobium sp. Root708]KRB49321.1 hypothetical protein ASE04_18725 [Rhizobium sp. Root708]
MAKQRMNNENESVTNETGIPAQAEISAVSDEDILDRIRSRAYHIWEADGGPHGRHDDHWLQAEKEILRENDEIDSDDVPNLAAAREAARQHTDTFIVASDLEDADQREATPGVREQP